MVYIGIVTLVLFAFAFSSYERRVWGSAKTPFAFTAYPLLTMLSVAVFVAPAFGFVTIDAGVTLVEGVFLVLMASTSLALRNVSGARAAIAPPLETSGPASANDWPARVSPVEYIGLALVLVGLFLPSFVVGGSPAVEKGELGVGGVGGHVIELGIAYLLIALCQPRGQKTVRLGFVVLVVWLLAVNQVKYLILLPFASALLYRWLSRQMATWKLAVLVVVVPLAIVVVIYTYFDVAAAASGLALSPALVAELAKHMVAYLVSGTLGLGELLRRGQLTALGTDGLVYSLAPTVNLARFVTGAGHYFDVVNPVYLVIHRDGVLDTNVFTLYGSLLFRAGWIGATAITLCYGTSCYWIWSRWRARRGVIDGAVGSWWMAPLLFAWHDPFFIHLSVIEILAFLWIRARLGRGVVLSRAGSARRMTAVSPERGAGG